MARKNNGRYQYNSFAGIPRIVMENPDYVNLSYSSKALLFELAYQYRGKNNGDLTVAWGVMSKRGFKSKETLGRLTDQLLRSNLVLRTREGRFTNPGGVCALYALTWQPIDECSGKGLEVKSTITAPRLFSKEINKTPGPENGLGSVHKLVRGRSRDGQGRYSSS